MQIMIWASKTILDMECQVLQLSALHRENSMRYRDSIDTHIWLLIFQLLQLYDSFITTRQVRLDQRQPQGIRSEDSRQHT